MILVNRYSGGTLISSKKIVIYVLIITSLVVLSTILLYSYDERIEIKNEENDSLYIQEIIEKIDNDTYVNIREDEIYSEEKINEEQEEKQKDTTEKKETKTEKEEKQKNTTTEKKETKTEKEDKDNEKEDNVYDIYYKNKSYAFDPNANYFIKKQIDPKYEKIIYSKPVTNEQMARGDFFNFSLYKVEYETYEENKKRIKRISRYSTNFFLVEFRDYIYKNEISKQFPVKIQTYDNIAKPTSYELWNYDNLGQLVEKIIYKDDKEYKKYLYDYDIAGNQIIRIEKVEDNIVEKIYSYYNQDNKLIRKEFFKFKSLMRTYIYEYYNNELYIKEMYDNTGMLSRRFYYRGVNNAEEIIMSLLPEELLIK